MERIASICHRKLGALLPRWMSQALPRVGDAPFSRRAPAADLLPASASSASVSTAAKHPGARAMRRNRAENVAPRPLRVLQIVDPFAPASGMGRIVISGRMADVCAELERLAAIESRRGCAQ